MDSIGLNASQNLSNRPQIFAFGGLKFKPQTQTLYYRDFCSYALPLAQLHTIAITKTQLHQRALLARAKVF
jgi:hypothetical protein